MRRLGGCFPRGYLRNLAEGRARTPCAPSLRAIGGQGLPALPFMRWLLSTKHQPPRTRETSRTEVQVAKHGSLTDNWSLVFGVSLDVGAWSFSNRLRSEDW